MYKSENEDVDEDEMGNDEDNDVEEDQEIEENKNEHVNKDAVWMTMEERKKRKNAKEKVDDKGEDKK